MFRRFQFFGANFAASAVPQFIRRSGPRRPIRVAVSRSTPAEARAPLAQAPRRAVDTTMAPGIVPGPLWKQVYRLEYCGALRAFLSPAFFRSVARASRVRKPAFFKVGRLLRSEEHTSELQSRGHLVCSILLEKKKKNRVRL